MSQQLTESTEKTKQQIPHRQLNSAPTRSLQGGFNSAILQLQRTLGNRCVAQLIQAKRITPEGRIIGLQRKLTVGAADDYYEQEADRVAHRVVSMPDSMAFASSQQRPAVVGEATQPQTLQSKPLPLAASITPFVQRKGHDSQINEPIQPASSASQTDSFEAGDDIESQVNQSKGSGSQLPDPVRAYMEPRFGADFSHVRVHTGSNAIQMNRDVGAQAFTHGSDIYYGAGNSPSNLELTAHELTHVVQQTGASIISGKSNKSVQRMCSGCEEETKRKIQPKLVVDRVEVKQKHEQQTALRPVNKRIQRAPFDPVGPDNAHCKDKVTEDGAVCADHVNTACSAAGAMIAAEGAIGGALVGSLFPVLGTTIGGVAGAVVGGIAGALSYGDCVERMNAACRARTRQALGRCDEQFPAPATSGLEQQGPSSTSEVEETAVG